MPARQTQKGRQTRERLLQAAAEELLERDGAMDFASVARRAGVSAGAPYRHFASKSQLLVALVDVFYDEWEAVAYRPTFEEVSEDWWERERERIRRTVEFYYGHPLGALMQQRLLGDAEAVRHQRVRADRTVKGAVENVARGQALGRVPAHIDAEICGALLMGGVGQALHRALAGKRRMSRARVTRELQAFMQRALCIDELEDES
ncbi:putative transcriptional regulator [Plesiocystis pacifica SIR-1]|uniref:Putative transcriptional regulator n=1 Tax=Plesiocystis pacifica SIR-1 TaxID=391625 RepID=A6GFX8_9BACT|nr:TetR/AcrR family transcriptional regulator [Plesiocystis pacifica]EDM75223.1 putative transcriptional regulator [Plesiocystis pacifica SIR-1]